MESYAQDDARDIEKVQPVEAVASENDSSYDRPPTERTAEDYAKAIAGILGIAAVVIDRAPIPGPGKTAASGAAKVAAAAIPAMQKAIPKVKDAVEKNPELVNKVVGVAKDAGSHAAKVARDAGTGAAKVAPGAFEKAGHAFGGGFGKARETLKGAAGKAVGVAGIAAGAAGSVAHGAAAKVKDAAAARDEEKARREARRVVLEGAGVRLTPKKFFENWNQHVFVAQSGASVASVSTDASGLQPQPQEHEAASSAGYLAYPGCYVVLTFGKGVKQDDYGKFRDVYVGASSNMGVAIRANFIGLGDPDVYADVKYQQDVRVLVFPCAEENLDQLRQSLIVALDADASYNRVRG